VDHYVPGEGATSQLPCPAGTHQPTAGSSSCIDDPVKQDQTITFATPRNQIIGATLALGATATSGLDVAFSSLTPAVCSIAGSTVTADSTGTCTIQATQGGNASYFAAAPVTRMFLVTPLLVSKGQAMEGDLKVAPGTVLKVGYDFTIPGNHPDTTVHFNTAKVTFTWTCQSNANTGTFDVTIGDQSYVDPLNSSAWYPSGDKNDPSVYQNSTFTVPAKCGGQLVRLQKGGVFSAGVSSSSSENINVRWHYSANGSAGGWSGTMGVPL